MGYLGATLTRAGGGDVSLRDVTIAQMGNRASECEWRHAPEARGGFWEIWKSQLIELSCWLAEARPVAFVAGATRDGGQMKKPE